MIILETVICAAIQLCLTVILNSISFSVVNTYLLRFKAAGTSSS